MDQRLFALPLVLAAAVQLGTLLHSSPRWFAAQIAQWTVVLLAAAGAWYFHEDFIWILIAWGLFTAFVLAPSWLTRRAQRFQVVGMKISDPEQYKQYMAAAPATVAAAGGEYLVRGGRHEALEGDWQPARVAILKFPSYEKAKAWYDEAGYPAVRTKRAGATEYFNMILVEGVPAPVS